MRITKAGIFVMIKSFGVEGLIADSQYQKVQVDTEKEQALVNGAELVRPFDTLRIKILPESVEFRRQIKFIYISRIEVGEQVGAADVEMAEEGGAGEQSLSEAKKSSKKRKNKQH